MACINNRWTKRALASAGFGFSNMEDDSSTYSRWKPVFSVAELGGHHSAATAAEDTENEKILKRQRMVDAEHASKTHTGDDPIAHDSSSTSSAEFDKGLGNSNAYLRHTQSKVAVVQGLNRPLFHIDLTSALQSAITNVESRSEFDPKGDYNGAL